MKKLLSFIGFFLLSVTIISAQITACPVNYSSALEQTETVCDDTGRNQACYGNNTVNITPFSQTAQYEFDTPGDMTDVELIRSLSLSALDEETGDWGISMLRLLANINPTHTDDVTVLLFGDVEMESAVEPTNTVPIITTTFANIRRYPNTSSSVMQSVVGESSLIATGRLADNSWVQLSESEFNVSGWIFTDLLDDFDIESLTIVDATQPYFAPMQAFYFSSGNHQSDCLSVPSDGLMIQTPVGVGRVTVWINEVTVDFLSNTGATAFVQTPSDDIMSIDMLEGDAYIGSEQGGYIAVAGSSITVDLPDEDSPKVNLPEPSTQQPDDISPVKIFTRPVEPIVPASVDDIALSNGLSTVQYDEIVIYGYVITNDDNQPSSDSELSVPLSSDDSQGQLSDVGNNTGKPNCPGNSCNAPGHNGNGNGNNGNGNSGNDNGKGKDKK